MYSKIHSRLDWFFGYIGEPEDDFVVELYGDVNFDGVLNINDIVLMVGFILGDEPTEEEELTAKKGDKVVAYDDEPPIDTVLGVEIFPVVHVKTQEKIYVSLEDIKDG